MDEYQHALFFEASDLKDRDKEKIRRHFQKRRDSGGGDCGMIEKAGCNIYKICFKEKEDQERVLQRKFHSISLPSGELRLIVSRTNSPLDQSSTSQSQTFTKANTKGLEKIFQLEIFLLYFLRDNLKAHKVLQKQLSSIGCTVELDFDKEEAVVRGDIEKGPGGSFGAAEKWEIQVDRVLVCFTETYLCYHVVEPKKIKILLQNPSLVTDDIKVYTESGYAVVVGEVEAVNERIAILEKSLPTRKELQIVKKKFKLVEEEFSREMRAHYPDVKIILGSGMIILEGPDKEVQSGATKLDELIKNVKEKRVKLCPVLMTFITSSCAISKYQARFQQSLRNPVSLEVVSDLVLSSLSSDALDEAEAAVQRDLTVANVTLQGAAAVPPDLDRVKEILIKAKNKANSQELRVDVSFIPGTATIKVQLVGYSENVNKLKEVLHDYQMNQVETQEVLNLPHPELLDCFDKILGLIGMKQTKVTLKASHLPYPCVLVSGPCCLVQETQQALISALASLTSDTLVLDGPGAQRYFQAEGKVGKELVETSCQVIVREQQGVHSSNAKIKPRSITCPSTSSFTVRPMPRLRSSTVGSIVVNKTSLKISLGSLVDEQVHVLVVPMLNRQLTSTNIGKCLLNKAGNAIKSKFDFMVANCTLVPGDVLQVDAPPSLGCSKLFFIECLPWDGVRGQSVQVLGNGLKKCLDLCVQLGLCSVAFPVIGPGVVLKYPLREAIQVLTENIRQFGLSASSGSLSTIHIVINPDYPDSEECYHDVNRHLSSNMNQGGQAIFRCLTSDLDDITMTVGSGVKLQLVFGDITNEVTDAVVNSTDFVNFQNDGVCKDILTLAGPEVEAELRAAKANRGDVFVSQAGLFPCEAIFHVCGEKDAVIIQQLVCRIVEYCELYNLKSVAIPAICAGAGGLDPGVVASAILQGIKAATSSTPLYFLTDIRLVLIKINVFLTFKDEAMQMFSTAVINRVPVPQLPHVLLQQQQQPPSSVSADLSILRISSASQQSVFLFLGLSRKDVDDAMTKLNDLYQAQCSTQTFKKEELEGLTQDDMQILMQLVETQGLYVQKDQSGQGTLTVSGLKDGVNQVMQLINVCLHGSLRREVRVREEEDLYNRVSWCILGYSGNWERLPKTANHNLENNDVAGGIVDAQRIQWSVNLQRMEATGPLPGHTAKLKRLENLSDFTLPLYWDNMAASEFFKVVALQPSSAEYRTVKEAFKRTVPKTVLKIERVQNVHLRRAYEGQKKHLSDNNNQLGGAGEKLLYHGTTHDNCDSIMKTGFNRRFSGQNATAYGHGTYFAVNASYSAIPTYSKPAADGSALMFVALVLTGIYTLGQSNMRVPPPRSDQQPHDRFDSVVDKIDNPNMYVVFHDNQAYPDYLITFK
ncbi:protein mono-ADP-ribosyltransferase PARP14-like [Sander vitreus]